MDYAEFSQSQYDYIRRSEGAWLNVAEGGKRAGKNIINTLAWAAAIDDHPDRLHLAGGVTQSSVMMNIIDSAGFGLKWLFEGRCRLGEYNKRAALIIRDTKGREKVVIIAGGRDSSSAAAIKGHSYGTAYVTEVNECHQTFFQEVMDRTLASSRRQLFFDLNSKPPGHWFYRDFLDFQDALKEKGQNPGYNYGHFTVLNNYSVTAAQLRELLSKYDRGSVWYQQDIAGLRTVASGRIYTPYRYRDVAITPKEIAKVPFRELSIGVDVGGTDATTATLTGFTQGFTQVVHIDGMYHKQGRDNKMDESLYCRMIADWLAPWVKIYPRLVGSIYVDSAAKLFTQGLRRELDRRGLGRYVVRGFDKSDGILERISLTTMLMNQGRFRISSAMTKWHEAYEMATWSEKEYERGEWVRVDDGSYPVDCLDGSEYSVYPFKRFLMP